MSFLHRNGLALRGIAVLLTAYCVLASGRAMVPGLCATLADADQKDAAACCNPKPACCHDESRAAGTAISSAAHACAFCMLVHTAAQPVALETSSAPAINTPLQLAAHEDYIADPASSGYFPPRAPPLS